MLVLQSRNVCAMLPRGLSYLTTYGEKSESRAGPVLVADTPVMSVYENPCERVLRAPWRDANPFFHLIESLWMLAGRDDVATLNHYVGDFGGRFAEDDGRVHGAYGHRWRKGLGFDQLDAIVQRLLKNPDDRQCVLQMWDARNEELMLAGDSDFNVIHDSGFMDLHGDWKDRPCNTHVYFRVRRVPADGIQALVGLETVPGVELVLDMTVCCRSNDIIWGAYGANAVHFSMLQEYVAGRARAKVGRMYQFSNNYHLYVKQLERMKISGTPAVASAPYGNGTGWDTMPIGEHWGAWDDDLTRFMDEHERLWSVGADIRQRAEYANGWFASVAWKVASVYFCHKHDLRDEALAVAAQIEAGDWRGACVEWLERRYAR